MFAFLTTDPNPLVAPIHPKAMPVLLDEEDEDRWLTCSFGDAVALAKPFQSQLMALRQDGATVLRFDNVAGDAGPLSE